MVQPLVRRLILRGQRVIVQRDEAIKKSGNIELPDSAQTKRPTGTVINMSEELTKRPDVTFKIGDRVLLDMFAGTEYDENLVPVYDRDGYLLVTFDDIAGVITNG